MLIYCPKCQQGYDVGEDLIPEEGRRLRCSSCGEVFKYDRSGETAVVKMRPHPAPAAGAEGGRAADNTAETAAAEEAKTAAETAGALLSEADNAAENTEITAEASENAAEASKNPDEEADAPETAEPEADIEEPVDINDIFKRLSEQTESLFEKEKKLTLRERLWLKFKTLTGWNIRLKLKYIIIFLLVITLISLYNNRYDIARKFPWTAPIYGVFGIKAQILGEGLEFQNIDWVYYNEEDAPRLEIKGFINNKTQRSLKIPTVHVEMLDENTNLLKSQNQQPEPDVLKAKSRLPLNIAVIKPSPTTKYVFLTFVESD